ncbi:MAG: rubrerythrin family protein [Acidobacteriota bacterium]
MTTRGFNYKTLQTGAILGCLAVLAFASLALLATAPQQTKTLQNLQTAYNAEANAYVRYLAFAQRAQEEEFGEAASLFRAAACAEHVHLKNLAAVIRKMGAEPAYRIDLPVPRTTWRNLQKSADEREASDRDALYPTFIEEAKAEGNQDAVRAFQYIQTAEVQQAKLFKAAIGNLKRMTAASHLYYVCNTCGYVSERPTKPCPGCSNPDASYEEMF